MPPTRSRASSSRWLAGSAHFRAFAEDHRDKIRKKLRTAGDDESLLDVRAELGAAHLLLADRRIELAYEAYGSGNAGPDFTLTFRGTRACNVEVTRSRRVPDADALGWVILAKLRQLPPSVPNLLLIAAAGEHAEALDVATAVRIVRSRAEAKDEAFFARRGFGGTHGFFDQFLRLGGVVTLVRGGVRRRAGGAVGERLGQDRGPGSGGAGHAGVPPPGRLTSIGVERRDRAAGSGGSCRRRQACGCEAASFWIEAIIARAWSRSFSFGCW